MGFRLSSLSSLAYPICTAPGETTCMEAFDSSDRLAGSDRRKLGHRLTDSHCTENHESTVPSSEADAA